mgnify:CR=1 FL=1
MPITLFDFKEWKDSLYKDLLQAYLKEWSLQDVQNFMADESKNWSKKATDDFMDFWEYHSSLQYHMYSDPIQFGENQGKKAYMIIKVEGQYKAMKGLMDKRIKPKPKKNIVDKYFQNLVIMDLITCHQSKNFRKLMGVKKGFFS